MNHIVLINTRYLERCLATGIPPADKATRWVANDGRTSIKAINLIWKFSAEPEKTLLAAALAKRERLEPGVLANLKAGSPVEIPVVKIPDADNRAHNVAKG